MGFYKTGIVLIIASKLQTDQAVVKDITTSATIIFQFRPYSHSQQGLIDLFFNGLTPVDEIKLIIIISAPKFAMVIKSINSRII